MTVDELYKAALAVVPSTTEEDDSLRTYMIEWTNLLLQETLKYENSVRVCRGDPELTTAPRVTSGADEIPYSPHLAENAFIWGIASFIMKDEDDTFHEQDYRGRYISACIEYTPLVRRAIVDMYRGELECQS